MFAKNDSIGHPWTAPAGYTRGNLSSTESLTTILSRKNMNDLASANINPLVVFPGQGPVVWGQKTLNDKMSAFASYNAIHLSFVQYITLLIMSLQLFLHLSNIFLIVSTLCWNKSTHSELLQYLTVSSSSAHILLYLHIDLFKFK
ncbi:MAG: hypothetical protein DSY42_09660 [Aquifex sp.]|nr:MAG: hypothetical protein DSY42_09660 [Aquifex sp.]